MSARSDRVRPINRANLGRAFAVMITALLASGCASDGGGSVSTSMSVGYGSYYGPGWYGGYYDPYPPVVVVPPGERPERPEQLPERPTTLPADLGGATPTPRAQTAPSRPSTVQRPTSRPSPRPAPRPMPRRGRR